MEIGGLATATPTDDTAMTMDQILLDRGYSVEDIEARSARLMSKQWKSAFFEIVEDD
jgi:hypothetical protein